MRKERMNNKGFSLVELIIVIAIMAILAAALAPNLMKYIEKSRVSTDLQTCATIKSSVNAAVADEAIYKKIADGKKSLNFTIKVGTNGGLTFAAVSAAPAVDPLLQDELKDSLKSLKAPNQSGKDCYQVKIEVVEAKDPTGTGLGTYSLGDVTVATAIESKAN